MTLPTDAEYWMAKALRYEQRLAAANELLREAKQHIESAYKVGTFARIAERIDAHLQECGQ